MPSDLIERMIEAHDRAAKHGQPPMRAAARVLVQHLDAEMSKDAVTPGLLILRRVASENGLQEPSEE